MRDRYADGVYFVDLSPLTDPTLVVTAIAAALGVPEVVDQPLLRTLSGFLGDEQVLLLLDNCEQVVAAAPDVAALLAASPDLAVLATSRCSLRIRGEREFPLLPLPLPDADRLPPLEVLAQVPAVALFLDLAAASQPAFSLTADNAAAAAGICRRLDGRPLAIELAAARMTLLSAAALLAQVDDRLRLPRGRVRDLPPRQRTMRDAIAWSYDLLGGEERALFHRLAVFAGGFALHAARSSLLEMSARLRHTTLGADAATRATFAADFSYAYAWLWVTDATPEGPGTPASDGYATPTVAGRAATPAPRR